MPTNALVNRNSSKWYLDALRVEVEWRLGFLDVVVEKWEQAFEHFDQVLAHDQAIRSANQKRYFNAYDRMKIARKNNSMVGVAEQNVGLRGKERLVIFWADLQYM